MKRTRMSAHFDHIRGEIITANKKSCIAFAVQLFLTSSVFFRLSGKNNVFA